MGNDYAKFNTDNFQEKEEPHREERLRAALQGAVEEVC